jgi:hypothetical protein
MTATVFLMVFAGHLLGDWVAQTDWQATTKTRSWAALAAHVATMPSPAVARSAVDSSGGAGPAPPGRSCHTTPGLHLPLESSTRCSPFA